MLDEKKLKDIQNECKKYNAKSIEEDKNVFEHNQDLDVIRKEIKEVFGLNEVIERKLDLACQLHDIGKCVKYFQDNLETKKRTIRHEIYGASIKGLPDNIKLAILTHHKDLDKLRENIVRNEYKSEMDELSEKFNLEFEDITHFIDLCKTRKGKKLVTDLDNIILKGLLNYCDHMASAGITTIDKGLDTINKFEIQGKPNSIQREVIALKEEIDILIMAMTGLGKTATSMFWSDIVQNTDKSKRIYYILPYTASINSQYKDMNEMGLSVAMLHSKAEYFLGKYKDDFTKDDYKAFKKSTKQINICTIFQLVKAMFGCKRFEMLLAQMKNSIFIVDEIHCFDMKELSYILEMLKWLKENLGASVCIMSASIPTCLQEVIKERLGITKFITADKKDLRIRHKIHRVRKTILDDLDKIEKCLEEGKQVILCVNNVETSQELYERFSVKYQTKLIHGRFNTRDREVAEQGLKTNKLLIGTQAIEVSLNIDYDVMFTEIAPWDALLQRFGRVNRKAEKDIADIFVYDNIKTIYDEVLIENTDKVISEVIEKDSSIILEEKVNYYLDKVYKEFNWDEYNKYIEYFDLLIKGLKIGSYNSDATDDMCGSETISILPKCLYTEFKDLIKEKKFLEAESLKVNVRKVKKFVDKDLFTYDTENYIYIANYKYDSKTGLKFDGNI
ncbi:CRISPR-associated helicase Cas3' [uncultured Clostridium sp.]|jgi:CRISPR-associated endonuclease/helicase Cas3|uniref:CRISPR-associated helicase Cas3' n=1 Tax=uncultured Clostridium sp. TaxID=59620 RepID=UPI00262D659B|nr:CRISPR-associated helicase Cas3' [uncultured Clostridium sp.]